MPERL
jgi:hypothetical protein